MWDKARNRVARPVQGAAAGGPPGAVGRHWTRALRPGPWLPWLLAALLVGLLAAIWIWGPLWQIGGTRPLAPWPNRLLVLLGVVLTVTVIIGLRLATRLRAAESVADASAAPDGLALASEAQARGLNGFLEQLQRHLGRGRQACHVLPWYLVLGPEGSGKTSLIQRSGQRFALTRTVQPLADEVPEAAQHWWVSDQAVMLEPGPRLLQHDIGDPAAAAPEADDGLGQALWDQLIGWVQWCRPHRPLDGVLLVLDLAWLASASPAARRSWTDTLRRRLQDLSRRYQCRLPIYVVFSQLDRLYGFEAFLRHYGEAGQDQPLGFSFSPKSQSEADAWEGEFAQAYERMLGRIERRLVTWLAACRDAEEREAVFRCSRQLAGLQPVLTETLQGLLSGRRNHSEPLVRGVYFTSVHQQGVPIDPFTDAATARYRLPAAVYRARRGAGSTAWFSEQLLQRVVFPEAGLAGESQRLVNRRRRLRGASIALCLAGLTGLVIGWGHYYQENLMALQAVEAKTQALGGMQPSVPGGEGAVGEGLVEWLDPLREATGVFVGHQGRWTGLSDLGLYQGHGVGPVVDQAYLDALQSHFLPVLMRELAHEMNTAEPGSEAQMARLRILRMLSDASGREPERVRAYLADHWQAQYPNRGRLQGRLLTHLDHALAHTDLVGHQAHDPRAAAALASVAGSIRHAQAAFSPTPVAERVYRQLKRRGAERAGGGVRLDRRVGSGWDTVFQPRDGDPTSVGVPPLLSRAGFETVFLEELDAATELAVRDLWVLGARDDLAFSDRDEQRLREALRERFVADFHIGWQRALEGIRITELQSIPHAVVVLDTMLGGARPLDRLLAEVARHTRLAPALAVGDDEAPGALRDASRDALAAELARPFEPLHALTRADDDGASDLAVIKSALAGLRDHLREIEQSAEPGRRAFRHARDRLLRASSDPVARVERLAEGLPAPLDGFLQALAAQSWQLITGEAVRYLERQWLDQVVSPFEADLAGRYPLDPAARREVALEDFEAFFAEGGILDTFYMDKLEPFLDEAPELLQDPDGTSLLNPALVTAVERGGRIREAYFGRDGLLDIGFTLTPVSLSGDKRRSVLNVDGQLLAYRHGAPQRVAMVWPNSLREGNESRITLVPDQVNRSPRSEGHRGAWAWFRLLDRADVIAAGEREIELTFQVDGGEMRYRLTADRVLNPFTRPLARGYRVPATLYRNGGADIAKAR